MRTVTSVDVQELKVFIFFFFNDTATTEIYTLSLHDALPIYALGRLRAPGRRLHAARAGVHPDGSAGERRVGDRKSTRLNSSHANISYAVFCLKKKKTPQSGSTCNDLICA